MPRTTTTRTGTTRTGTTRTGTTRTSLRWNRALAVPAVGFSALLMAAAPALAADTPTQATLKSVNDADAAGRAMVEVDGTTLTVHLTSTGLVADQPHAAHIHFGAEARHECPTSADDSNHDGHVNTTEGAPAYGEIVVSLTKTGDTSPASGLAVDRFDTAPGGRIDYERGSIQVSPEVAHAISAGESAVVVHGVDYNGDGKYSGDVKSDLDPSLPTEATDPAICGVLTASQMSAMPSGGVSTGGGSTAGVERVGLLATGGVALLGGVGMLARRRTSQASAR